MIAGLLGTVPCADFRTDTSASGAPMRCAWTACGLTDASGVAIARSTAKQIGLVLCARWRNRKVVQSPDQQRPYISGKDRHGPVAFRLGNFFLDLGI